MKERREGRIGTVSGLALLIGGTTLSAAVGGDHQSLSATLLLGTLTAGLGHSLIEEMKRQARRAQARWTREDTTNTVLLAVWAEVALLMSILVLDTWPTRGSGLALAVAYIACCAFFVTERRRTVGAQTQPGAKETGSTKAAPIETASDFPDTAAAAGTRDIEAASGGTKAAGTTALPGDGAVLRRRHAGHAPTAGHGPMTRSHAAGHAPTTGHSPTTRSHVAGHGSTLPAHSRPASLPGPAPFAAGHPAAVRSEAPR